MADWSQKVKRSRRKRGGGEKTRRERETNGSLGHPIGATGLGQCAELCWQVTTLLSPYSLLPSSPPSLLPSFPPSLLLCVSTPSTPLPLYPSTPQPLSPSAPLPLSPSPPLPLSPSPPLPLSPLPLSPSLPLSLSPSLPPLSPSPPPLLLIYSISFHFISATKRMWEETSGGS